MMGAAILVASYPRPQMTIINSALSPWLSGRSSMRNHSCKWETAKALVLVLLQTGT